MQLQRLDRRPLPEAIASVLAEAIEAGELEPGDRLPTEPELARQLGVGRTSLREALSRLQTLGYVDVRKGRGTFVREKRGGDAGDIYARWSAEHHIAVEELLETRIALEAVAAALAAVRATKEQMQALREALAADEALGAEADVGDRVEADQGFHAAIVAASNNPLLDRIYRLLVPELEEFRRKSLAVEDVAGRSQQAHAAIADAIRARDPQRARAALIAHLWTLYEEVASAAGSRARGAKEAYEPGDVFG